MTRSNQGFEAICCFGMFSSVSICWKSGHISLYVDDLHSVIDMEAIAAAGLNIGVDPMGGAGVAFWEPIAERYGLRLNVVNPHIDPTFGFMTIDHDGKIRMDCSSPYATPHVPPVPLWQLGVHTSTPSPSCVGWLSRRSCSTPSLRSVVRS